ncbi:MAG TPA: histone deacetylase family protein [Candidatus Acidoferrales bacterium]|nr:histone deacetylase family protein [Candidatus Acidoferrales bacterium]
MTTAFLTHPVFLKHDMGSHHPERPARLEAIHRLLQTRGLLERVQTHEAPRVESAVLGRVHDAAYLRQLAALAPQEGYAFIDPDTAMNPYTLEAAERAAGAAVRAVDLVLGGKVDNAFCCVRPPGHHAERNRAMGFCFYNNIACAAVQALDIYGLDRIAILDFDVHHGNGTEDIFRDDPRVMFCSSFQHPFYPNTPIDHAHARIISVPLPAGTRGMDFREAIGAAWFPALERFAPQMVFVSAGFDAHHEDPMADLSLNERDYAWISEEIVRFAIRHCGGRIVSSLEGGYHLTALAESVAVHVSTLLQG